MSVMQFTGKEFKKLGGTRTTGNIYQSADF